MGALRWILSGLSKGRSMAGGFIVFVQFLRRSKLWIPVVFLFFSVPQMLGSYAFMVENGVPKWLAVPTAVGNDFGGNALTVLNTVSQLAVQDVNLGYAVFLLLGVGSSILSLIMFFHIWVYGNRFLTTTMNAFHILLLGVLFLVTMMGLTFVVDVFVLPETTTRVSGLTYFLDNPRESMQPITFLVKDHVLGMNVSAASGNLSAPPTGVNETLETAANITSTS